MLLVRNMSLLHALYQKKLHHTFNPDAQQGYICTCLGSLLCIGPWMILSSVVNCRPQSVMYNPVLTLLYALLRTLIILAAQLFSYTCGQSSRFSPRAT
jgi:hypothetical protein